jgi:hypothetical protein
MFNRLRIWSSDSPKPEWQLTTHPKSGWSPHDAVQKMSSMSEQTMVDETRRFDQLTADLKIQPYDTGHQKPVPSDGG